MITNLKDDLNIDPDRVYLAGYSMGGSFAHRVANEIPDQLAGVATVGAWLTGKEPLEGGPINVLEIHAKEDTTVPYDGRAWWLKMETAEELKQHYLKRDHITTPPETDTKILPDGKIAITQDWTNPQTGIELKHITIDGQNQHLYFGGKGAEDTSPNVTDEFMNFFSQHKRNTPPPTQ